MTGADGTNNISRLAGWLAERRWYGDKSRELRDADARFHASIDDGDVHATLDILRLQFATGPPADYLLMRDRHDPDTDAIEHRSFRTWLLEGFAGSRRLTGDSGGTLAWHASPELVADVAQLAPESRVFRGEQSNSSIVFGVIIMLKVFRKLRPGVNPEVEIGEFLTRHTDFRAFPRMLGTITLGDDGNPTTVAAAQEFIPGAGDAWAWMTSRSGDANGRGVALEAASLLGRRTAEMHLALASGTSTAFAPETASPAYAAAVREDGLAELRETVALLEQHGVDDAAHLGERLRESLQALDRLNGTMITRIHGDYHLGQVLRTYDGDFAILDFEGEPARTLAERRAKASPLRDVAGMLRSFDYAAETAKRSSGVPDAIDEWHQAARAAFLESYRTTIASNDVLTHGWNAPSRQAVLAALEVHKALYEVRYELANRPGWRDIPLSALRRIANRAEHD